MKFIKPRIIMSHYASSRCLPRIAAVFLGLLLPALGQEDGKDDGKKQEPALRFICISSLVEDQEVVLASKDEDGQWKEHGKAHLRSSSITDWMPAKAAELHLALREDKGLKSICHFTCPAAASRVLVVLRTNAANDAYEAHVMDPKEAGFDKSTVTMVNFSTIAALVKLGTDEYKVEAGQQMVAKPTPGDSGKYRLMAYRHEVDGKSVLCYDRYVSTNPNTRCMLFVLPDKSRGLRVFSLPIFGSFD